MSPEAVAEMKRMLREKEMKLTDIRLDALTSAHQLEQLRDAMGKMKVCKNDVTLLKIVLKLTIFKNMLLRYWIIWSEYELIQFRTDLYKL